MKKTSVLLCLLVLISTSTVFALPVTFDLTVPSTDFSYSSNGTGLAVTASFDGGNAAEVTRTTSGLGVLASAVGDTTYTLDGDALDTLEFKFSQTVQLLTATFRWVNPQDDFSLLVDGLEIIATTPVLESFDFAPLSLFGERFSFAATEADDSFRIASITVDAPVPAPEPSTWLLFCSGLAGLYSWRKRMAS